MQRQWDVVVIGAGPAGLAAARAAADEGLSCACIERLGPGGVLMNLGHLHDYPDAAPGATGADLAAGLLDEAMGAGVEIVFAEARDLSGGPPWVVRTDDEEHGAKAVVVATGLSAGSLGIPGEQAFEGRGLSHCATCDGPLFAGQSVVVAGNDRWTLREALELSEIAGRVTVVGEAGEGGEGLASTESISMLPGRVAALKGSDGLEAVVVAHEGNEVEIEARGIFAYLDRQPELEFTNGRLGVDSAGRIVVDDALLACVPLVFAAGDVRADSVETLAAAISDGRRAGLAAARLLKRQSGTGQPG